MDWRTIQVHWPVCKCEDHSALSIMREALPLLRHHIEADAAEYYGCEIKQLKREQTQKFLLNEYDFDAIDISKLVAYATKLNSQGE